MITTFYCFIVSTLNLCSLRRKRYLASLVHGTDGRVLVAPLYYQQNKCTFCISRQFPYQLYLQFPRMLHTHHYQALRELVTSLPTYKLTPHSGILYRPHQISRQTLFYSPRALDSNWKLIIHTTYLKGHFLIHNHHERIY